LINGSRCFATSRGLTAACGELSLEGPRRLPDRNPPTRWSLPQRLLYQERNTEVLGEPVVRGPCQPL